jgi:Raf kinase inhibitor-like YbhB/YbcL family protein
MGHEHSSSGELITIQRVQPIQSGRLCLASSAIGPHDRIQDLYSAYHENVSPPLSWTGMPDADTFALIVEDPDAPQEKPFLHWAIWNIPGWLDGLPPGLKAQPVLQNLGGAVQGRNGGGQFGYMGPRPPAGHGLHHYHFQLFALDRTLPMAPDAPLEELVGALKAHAIADAELVGLYEQPDPQDVD